MDSSSDIDLIKVFKALWDKTTGREKKDLLIRLLDGKVTIDDVQTIITRPTAPRKPLISKVLGVIIPILIIALIAVGFFIGGKKRGSEIALSWILWNGSLAALGSLISMAHPVVILVSFVAAPLTSLCPLIGAGFVAAAVQIAFRRPLLSDAKNLSLDSKSFKGFYHNRLLKVIMVFVLCSLGSSIGTFVSGADIITKIAEMVHSFTRV